MERIALFGFFAESHEIVPQYGTHRPARVLPMKRISKSKHVRLGLCALLSSLGVLGFSRAAKADNAIPDANGSGMDTHLFRPAVDSKGLFTTNGSDILGANDISFG